MTVTGLMDRSRKLKETNTVKNVLEKEEVPKEGVTKKVVKISEDSPMIVEPATLPTTSRKSRPKSAEILAPYRPRSRSLQSRRPRSAQVTSKVPDPDKERKDLIASFNRSLRLLGLQVEELRREDNTPRKPPKVEGPSFSTRLHTRTVSLDSLRASALSGLEDRRAVASAVYQEWYFGKQQSERERRQRESLRREEEEREREQRKQELSVRAEENFAEWRRRKAREGAQERARGREREAEMERLRADAAKIQKALAEWNNNKARQLRKEAKERREKEAKEAEKKVRDEQQKQQHAREAYAAWQKKAAESLHTKTVQEQKQRETAEGQLAKGQQRRKEAQECFTAWKQVKDQQIKDKIKQTRLRSAQSATERGQRLSERLYEAEQAYLEWLDSLESRGGRPRGVAASPWN